MKANELAGSIEALNEQVKKSRQEIVDRLAALEAQLQNVDLPADATAALEALRASVQAVDDLTPDAPPANPETPA